MAKNNELVCPEIFSNEFVANIENLKFTLITQQTEAYEKHRTSDNVNMHFHTCYELFLCERGNMSVHVEDRRITLKRGEMIIVSPKVSHAQADTSKGCKNYCLRFVVAPNGLKTGFDLHKTILAIISDSTAVIPASEELLQTVSDISTKSEEKDFYSVSKHIYSFLIQLVELTGNVPQSLGSVFADNVELRTHKLRVFINNNISKQITLKEIASYINMSTRQTSRLIKFKFGCGFKEYVTKLRMEKAGRLVLQRAYPVSEIARMVGYSSERGFYTAFKNYFGRLPKEYRKKYFG